MDAYGILYITPHTLNESQTKNTRPMLDETQWVNVNTIPSFGLYCGTTRKIFETVDKKGFPSFGERTVGSYLEIHTITSRE